MSENPVAEATPSSFGGLAEEECELQQTLHWLTVSTIAMILATGFMFGSIPGIPLVVLRIFPLIIAVMQGAMLWRFWRIERRRIERLKATLPPLLILPHDLDFCQSRLGDFAEPRDILRRVLRALPFRLKWSAVKVRQGGLGWRIEARAGNDTVAWVGRLREQGSGTGFEGFFHSTHDPLDRIFPTLWLGIMGMIMVLALGSAVYELFNGRTAKALNALLMLPFCMAMAGALFVILKARQMMAQRAARTVSRWLQDNLEARPIDETAPVPRPPLW